MPGVLCNLAPEERLGSAISFPKRMNMIQGYEMWCQPVNKESWRQISKVILGGKPLEKFLQFQIQS